MRKLILITLFLLFFSVSAWGGRSISMDDEETFDASGSITDIELEECGGTVTWTTSACFSGGCAKVTPPTSACTGGGINGGQTGFGWFDYSGQTEIHIRFLIYFGSSFASNVANGGGGLINKFILQDSPSRTGILGLNGSDTDGRYLAFGALSSGEAYVFRTPPNRGWIEDAEFEIRDTEHEEEWIAVEYWINTSTGYTGIYLWTQDEVFSGVLVEDVPAPTGVSQTGFYISYYNCYGVANADNYYLMDNLKVSDSYIGPPAGFVGGEPEVPANAIQGVSITP